ncbi:MAG: TRAP transporter substrate-binding protein [Rhodobacteraceae bacterium]|nr:TRAP transporter substrate-binding protein [Paracoccaceae bacterium]
MKRLGTVLAASLLALAMGTGGAAAETVLKAGHISPKDSLEGMAVDRFAELVREKTGGAVVVEVFPSEQLGKGVAQIDSTMIGNQDLYFGGSPEFERFSDGLKLLGLNWVIPSQAAFRRVTEDPVWNDILIDPLAAAGLVVLNSNWERGPYRVMVSTRPITSIADMRGLKFRIAPIDTWRKAWGAVGTDMVVLAWTDVYLGLKQGTVEAVTSPISLVRPMKFTEVAKHIIRTDEFWQVLLPVINKDRFESLTGDQRAALLAAAAEAGQWYVAEQETRGDADIALMREQDGADFTTIDLAPGIALMQPVVRALEAEGFIPAGLYDRVLAIAAAG